MLMVLSIMIIHITYTSISISMSLSLYIDIDTYIYIYIYIHMYTDIHYILYRRRPLRRPDRGEAAAPQARDAGAYQSIIIDVYVLT